MSMTFRHHPTLIRYFLEMSTFALLRISGVTIEYSLLFTSAQLQL